MSILESLHKGNADGVCSVRQCNWPTSEHYDFGLVVKTERGETLIHTNLIDVWIAKPIRGAAQ